MIKSFRTAAAVFRKARTGLLSLGIEFHIDIDGVGIASEFIVFPMESNDPDKEPLGITRAREIAPVIGYTPKKFLTELMAQKPSLLKKLAGITGEASLDQTIECNPETGKEETVTEVMRLYFGDNSVTKADEKAVSTAIDKWL